MDIAELLQTKREEILRLASKYGAYNVRVFGSVARGEARTDSDVDLLVDLRPECGIEYIAFRQDLQDLLGHPVDLVTERSLHADIRDEVLGEAVAL